jgi:hypothetical protein
VIVSRITLIPRGLPDEQSEKGYDPGMLPNSEGLSWIEGIRTTIGVGARELALEGADYIVSRNI